MIANGKALIHLIDTILSQRGFIKKKDTWYKQTSECITFFTIEKSPYGGRYDHAFGFFLNHLNKAEKEYPVFYKCDLKIGLEFFADNELVKRILDLENQEFKNTEREFLITEMFDLYITPFLDEVGSKEGIKSAVKRHDNLIYYLKVDAMNYLNIAPPNG